MLGRCRLEVLRQLVELKVPETPVVLDPGGRFAHRCNDERRSANTSFAANLRQAGALEHPHVLGDGGQCHVEAARKLTDGPVAPCEPGENLAARGVSEGREGGVENGVIVNHMV
jgi:hypothetical protein